MSPWRAILRRLRAPAQQPTLCDPCPGRPWGLHSVWYRGDSTAECTACGATEPSDEHLSRSSPQGLARGRGAWVLASTEAGEWLWSGRVAGPSRGLLTPVHVLLELVVLHPTRLLKARVSAPSPQQAITPIKEALMAQRDVRHEHRDDEEGQHRLVVEGRATEWVGWSSVCMWPEDCADYDESGDEPTEFIALTEFHTPVHGGVVYSAEVIETTRG